MAKKQKRTENKSVETKERKAEEAKALVTINGDKVTDARVFQKEGNDKDYFFSAKLNGKNLFPMKMKDADIVAWEENKTTVEKMIKTYYPSKMEKRLSKEEFQAANILSDGREINKMTVFKEKKEDSPDYGRYKLYAEVGDKKMWTVMNFNDLNSYFDRTTTPAKLVEKNFGEKLNLASHYKNFKLPEGMVNLSVFIAKEKEDNKWYISVKNGENASMKKELSFDDGRSYFNTKTATKEQLAVKYFGNNIKDLVGQKQEINKSLKR